MHSNRSRTPITIRILPIHNKELTDRTDRFCDKNYDIYTPFPWRMKRIPTPKHPPQAIVINSQMIIPVQQLMMRRKSNEAAMEHMAATTKIGQPCFKLKAHKL